MEKLTYKRSKAKFQKNKYINKSKKSVSIKIKLKAKRKEQYQIKGRKRVHPISLRVHGFGKSPKNSCHCGRPDQCGPTWKNIAGLFDAQSHLYL